MSSFRATTALLTILFTALVATLALWRTIHGIAVYDFAGGLFGVVADQRELVYRVGCVLPIAAFASALVHAAHDGSLRAPWRVVRRSVTVAVLVFVCMALLSPLFEAAVMRLVLPTVPPNYAPQGWRFFWQYYVETPQPLPGPSMDLEYWRVAGVFAFTPIALGATSLCTTVLGHLLSVPRTELRTPRVWLLSSALLSLIYTAWRAAWHLTLQHGLDPEYGLVLVLLGPALLTLGALLMMRPGALRAA